MNQTSEKCICGHSEGNHVFPERYCFLCRCDSYQPSEKCKANFPHRHLGIECGNEDANIEMFKDMKSETSWERQFSKKFTDNVLKDGYGNDLITDDAAPIMKFIQQKLKEERAKKVDRDDAWRAYLQKLAWKKEEIDDATEWVDRTPLRLRSNHSLESIIQGK